VLRWLETGRSPAAGAPIVAAAPLRWVAPSVLSPDAGEPSRRRLLLWSSEGRRNARIVVTQGGTVLSRRTLPWPVSPGRVLRVPWSVLDRADPHGPTVAIALD
jgi:hypothetical protein